MKRFLVAIILTGLMVAGFAVRDAMRGPDLSHVHAVTTTAAEIDFSAADVAANRALDTFYIPLYGKWATSGWWNAANAVQAYVGEIRATGDTALAGRIGDAYTAALGANTGMGEYYDDVLWWGLTWMDVYNLTHDPRYLVTAENQFAFSTAGWTSVCGGGIRWNTKPDGDGKNSITSGEFMELAGELYLATHRTQYLHWAQRSWSWLSARMVKHGSVADNLTNDGTCRPYGSESYDAGPIMAGLVAIGDDADAHMIGDAYVAAHPLVADVCEANESCGPNQPTFKGVFIRDLEIANTDGRYNAYIVRQADTMYRHDRGTGNFYGARLSGPLYDVSSYAQISAVMILDAAAQVERRIG